MYELHFVGGDGDFNKILKMLEKANADDTVDTLF